MPLDINIETITYLNNIARFKNNFLIQMEGYNKYRVTKCLMTSTAMDFKKLYKSI